MNSHLIAALTLLIGFSIAGVDAAEQGPEESSARLLKPAPNDHSPFLPVAEAFARSKYPELFRGKFSGTIEINVDLNIAGDVLATVVRQYPPGPASEQSLTKAQRDALMEETLHDVYARAGALGTRFIGWYGAKNDSGLYLSYRVLKWRIDPSRGVGRVQKATAVKYPQFYRARPLSAANEESSAAIATVVMNDDGTIGAATLLENASDEDSTDRKMFDRFLALGLKPENLAYRGRTTNRGDWHEKNLTAPLLSIEYAWRRINDDPPDEILQSLDVFEPVSLSHLRDQQSHPSDEAFLERYFSDVWQNGLGNEAAAAWLLLARDGRVLDKGKSTESDMRAIEEQLQKKYGGIKINEVANSSAKSKAGSRVSLFYAWVAADSPVIPTQAAGLERK